MTDKQKLIAYLLGELLAQIEIADAGDPSALSRAALIAIQVRALITES